MKFGVVVFPGSNCDHDAYHVIGNVLGKPVQFIWHESSDLQGVDALILPGGFSYGDYLRTGALARFSPVMKAVEKFAHSGGLVLGVCNGFQILLEAGLLPGAMLRNAGLRFVCRPVYIRVETTRNSIHLRRESGRRNRSPHRARRWKLFLRCRNSRRARTQRSNSVSLHHARWPRSSFRESKWLTRKHCRDFQS